MNSSVAEIGFPIQSRLTGRSIAWCALLWGLLVLAELVPNLYVDWMNGDAPEFNQLARSASIYLYWFGMSIVIGVWLLRYPLSSGRNWWAHLGLAAVLSSGFIVWSAVSVKIFAIPNFSELPLGSLLVDFFLRFFLGELAIYAIITGAWILGRRQPMQLISRQKSTDSELLVRENGSLRRILGSDIVRLEAMENYVVIHTKEDKLVHRATLKATLKNLGEDFIQVHRSSAVNRSFVNRLNYAEKRLELIDGESIPVGRRRLTEVSRCLLNKAEVTE